ncbi:hypothetical protein GEMRC1_004078 [Eukaryota sp. GEM-RC1]
MKLKSKKVKEVESNLKQRDNENKLLAARLFDLQSKTQKYRLEIKTFKVVHLSSFGNADGVINVCKNPRTRELMLEISYGSTLKVFTLSSVIRIVELSSDSFKIEYSENDYDCFATQDANADVEILKEFLKYTAEEESPASARVADELFAFLGL